MALHILSLKIKGELCFFGRYTDAHTQVLPFEPYAYVESLYVTLGTCEAVVSDAR